VARPNAIFFSFCACWLFGTFFPVIQTQRPNHFFPLGNFHSEHEQGYDSRYGLFSAACIDKFVCPGRGRFHWLPSSGRHHGRILRLSYNCQYLGFGIVTQAACLYIWGFQRGCWPLHAGFRDWQLEGDSWLCHSDMLSAIVTH